MSIQLNAEVDRNFSDRDRSDMAPTIAALLPLYEQHPRDPCRMPPSASRAARSSSRNVKTVSSGRETSLTRAYLLEEGR